MGRVIYDPPFLFYLIEARIMNKMLYARLGFIIFSLGIAYGILSKTFEVPIAIALWVVGMAVFIRFRKRDKMERGSSE